jgi:site-specific recombinase XerD
VTREHSDQWWWLLSGGHHAAGLPPVRLHDLRYGAASPALAAGVDLKVVQEMLGHASIVTTANSCAPVTVPGSGRRAPHAA